MANSNTEHSKKLRAESAQKAMKKALADGAVQVTVRLPKCYAEKFTALTNEHGTKIGAIKFLLDFYEKNKK